MIRVWLKTVGEINRWAFCELACGELLGGFIFASLLFLILFGWKEAVCVAVLWLASLLVSMALDFCLPNS